MHIKCIRCVFNMSAVQAPRDPGLGRRIQEGPRPGRNGMPPAAFWLDGPGPRWTRAGTAPTPGPGQARAGRLAGLLAGLEAGSLVGWLAGQLACGRPVVRAVVRAIVGPSALVECWLAG